MLSRFMTNVEKSIGVSISSSTEVGGSGVKALTDVSMRSIYSLLSARASSLHFALVTLSLNLNTDEKSKSARNVVVTSKAVGVGVGVVYCRRGLKEGGGGGMVVVKADEAISLSAEETFSKFRIFSVSWTLKKQTRRTLYSHKEMDLETVQTNATAKLPILKQENGNSFKPTTRTKTNADGTSTSMIPGPVTTKEKAQKKNNVKARMVWRNKSDLDTISIDDLYNNFKIVEQEVKRTVTSSSNSNSRSQNIAFVSSPNSTNEVNTANSIFLANQPNGSQLVHEDLEQIHEDDLEEMDLKWQLALLSMRARRYFQRSGKKITINGSDIAGYDKSKSFMADEEVPTNMALIAFSDSEFNKSEFNLATYKRGLASVEEQLIFYKKNEVMFYDQIAVLKRDTSFKDSEINALKRSQISDNSRKGVGFVSYNDVPPPPTGLFVTPTIDLSNSGLEEFQQPEFEGYGHKASKSVCKDTSNEVEKTPDAPLGKKLVLVKEKQTVFLTKIESGHLKKEDQGYVDSRCSRHMTGNMSYLSDFKEFDGGYVTFGGGAKGGRITGKGTLKTGKLDFEDVYFVKEL
ncbi:hypothetical protein Tco_0010090 [Tanacetum coccineum]